MLVQMLPFMERSFFAGDRVPYIIISKPYKSLTRCVIFPFTDEGELVKSGYVIWSR